jgi:phosphoribosyl 1,2-cyclic phosphodiesterase
LYFCILASGSRGNASYVANAKGALLIDCGLSLKKCLHELRMRALDPFALQGIVLTHEHSDHLSGVQSMAEFLRIPVLTSVKTWRQSKLQCDLLPLQTGKNFIFAGFNLRPFRVSHDAADPLALVLEAENCRLGYCTDLGRLTPAVCDNLQGCTALALEFNHDPDMLSQGPYPAWLKARVAGPRGHLSNATALDLLEKVWHPGLRLVVAAHLSQTNNSVELVKAMWQKHLSALSAPPFFEIARQQGGMAGIELADFVSRQVMCG